MVRAPISTSLPKRTIRNDQNLVVGKAAKLYLINIVCQRLNEWRYVQCSSRNPHAWIRFSLLLSLLLCYRYSIDRKSVQ